MNRLLVQAMDAAGYPRLSYYAVPGGFAIATQLEQINPDGSPREGDDRWTGETVPPRGLLRIIRGIFQGNPGRYRIVVFVVTPAPFTNELREISREEAELWVEAGADRLPAEIGNRSYSDRHETSALIYEFEQARPDEPAAIVKPSRLSARRHLQLAGVLGALGGGNAP